MSEHDEQCAFIDWLDWEAQRNPKLEAVYATPNAAKRSWALARYLRNEGLRSGVPDVCIAVPAGDYHALYIEMKVGRNKPTPEQKRWLGRLFANGNACRVCYSASEAIETVKLYLRGEIIQCNW